MSRFLHAVVLLALPLLYACGGGGGSSASPDPVAATPPSPAVGRLSVLVGDSPLDGIESVLINISEIILIGGDDGQVSITDGPIGEIDLLTLQNITELVASAEVPAGSYSKIRLRITSLTVIEETTLAREDVQLPANGRIDLNPQGPFEISAGEDLVIQIDFDLARSIKLTTTGSGRYRFRPVVFIDVLDQTESLRLSKLFGELQADNDDAADAAGRVSDADLCTEANADPCVDVVYADGVEIIGADGVSIIAADLVLPEDAYLFGHYFVGAAGGEFFRAKLVVFGAADSLTQVMGEITTLIDTNRFELRLSELDSTELVTTDALLLDDLGALLEIDIVVTQIADAWAQNVVVEAADEGTFPAFLVQISPADLEESVEGTLVDIVDMRLTVSGIDGEFCVDVTSETEVQLLSDFADDAETDTISLTALGDLISAGVTVEAFGVAGVDCFNADLIAAEVP